MAGASAAPKIKLESVERFERDFKLRLPFRFGVITVTAGTQAVIRATIALEDGRTATGVAAESLGAKWFDKNPAFSDAQNLDQLRQALELAIDLYRAARLEHAVWPLRGDLSRPDGARRGSRACAAGGLLRPGAARPGHPRCAGPGAGAFLCGDDRAQCCGDCSDPGADAGSRRLRPAALLERPAAGARPSPCATRSASSIPSSRPIRRRASASTTACRKRWRKSSATTARATTS